MIRKLRVSYPALGTSVVLVALVWIVFAQTAGFQFVNYDDNSYVFRNANIRAGVTWHGVGWAFTHVHSENWHPITSISHMVDTQLFGLKPAGPHLVNVALHTIATLLLFGFLLRTTGVVWASGIAAVFFAIHPLRAESVAWISERKDVLSGAFFMATLLSYSTYVRRASWKWFTITLCTFSLGLMSKPMLVTTPLVLLLLDYWPLRRANVGVRRLVLEKVPFAILSLGSCIATLLAQNFAMASSANMPLTWRLSNAAVSYVNYLRQIFWPADLVPFYQHPEYTLALWQIIGALLLIVLVTIVAFCLRRRMPYVVVGWVWYLVTLLPVIGFVQVGLQARADRYMYLPQIGIIIAVVWLARELLIHWPRLRYVTAALALATIVLLAFLCHAQASHWRDSKSLWGYTLSKSPNNDVAHGGLGGILLTEGDLDGAVAHFERALQIRSGNVAAHNGLALAFAQQRKLDAAIEHWQKAVEILPDDTEMLNHLGAALAGVGRTEEAIEQWERALAFDPDNIDAAVALAWTFATATDSNLRNGAKAVEYARRAASAPLGDTFMVYRTLAAACAEARDFDAAIRAAGHAQALAQAAGNQNGAAEMERWTQVFRQRQTLREAFTGR